MSINKSEKEKIIEEFKTHDGDCGSTQVQIALLTSEINNLTEHLKEHKHDYHSNRGLLKKVGQRKRLLTYLKDKDIVAYRKKIIKVDTKY